MKPKFLALLVAIPFGAFAMSTTLMPTDGKDGHKDKPGTETRTQKKADESQQAQAAVQETTPAVADAVTPAVLTTRQLADEMKKGMEILQQKPRNLRDEHEELFWDLGEEGNALVEEKLAVPVRKALHLQLDEDSFSRCPSGIDQLAYILADDKTTGEGYVTRYIGCRSTCLSLFRFNTATQTVTMWVSDDAGFVSVDNWVKAYKLYQQDAEQKG